MFLKFHHDKQVVILIQLYLTCTDHMFGNPLVAVTFHPQCLGCHSQNCQNIQCWQMYHWNQKTCCLLYLKIFLANYIFLSFSCSCASGNVLCLQLQVVSIALFSGTQCGAIDASGGPRSGAIDAFGGTQSGPIDTVGGPQSGPIDVFSAPCSTRIST